MTSRKAVIFSRQTCWGCMTTQKILQSKILNSNASIVIGRCHHALRSQHTPVSSFSASHAARSSAASPRTTRASFLWVCISLGRSCSSTPRRRRIDQNHPKPIAIGVSVLKPEKLQNESQRFPFSTTRSCLRPRVESDVLGRSQIYPH